MQPARIGFAEQRDQLALPCLRFKNLAGDFGIEGIHVKLISAIVPNEDQEDNSAHHSRLKQTQISAVSDLEGTKPVCNFDETTVRSAALSEKDSQVASSVPVVDRQAQRMLGLFHMKQSAARPAHAPTRSARLARVVAEANGKAPAGVRLIDTQRSLSPGEVQRGKVLERMARRIRENGDKNLEARTRRVADGGDPTLKKVSRRVKPQ